MIAAVAFLLWRNSFTPKLDISNVIAHGKDFEQPCYLIKVINLRHRPIFNIKAEMFVATVFQKQEGQEEHTKQIHLKKSVIVQLSPYLSSWSEYPDHIWRFVTYEDIPSLLNENTNHYVKIIVSGYDSISGKGLTFFKRYTFDDIKEGSFYADNRLDVKSANK